MRKLLIHTCCGPCFSYIEYDLRKNGLLNEDGSYEKVDYTAFFYNFNIHMEEEYEKRKESFLKLCMITNTKYYIKDKYGFDEFLNGIKEDVGKDKKFNKRCHFCYYKRLYETFIYAKENNFDIVSTTLTISPYQDHNAIKMIGKALEKEFDIEFKYVDYRPYYRKGQDMAKEYGLYRQKYCGCIFSLNESQKLEGILEKEKKSKLKLLKPSTMFKKQMDDYINELKSFNSENIYDFIENSQVKQNVLLVIRKHDNNLIGMVYIDDKTKGNQVEISYNILPYEKGKDYEIELVKLALIKCKRSRKNDVLICCNKNDTSLKEFILSNGGTIKNDSCDNEYKQIYNMNLN